MIHAGQFKGKEREGLDYESVDEKTKIHWHAKAPSAQKKNFEQSVKKMAFAVLAPWCGTLRALFKNKKP